MMVVDGQGVPIGRTLASTSPAEVKLAEETLETVSVTRKGEYEKAISNFENALKDDFGALMKEK